MINMRHMHCEGKVLTMVGYKKKKAPREPEHPETEGSFLSVFPNETFQKKAAEAFAQVLSELDREKQENELKISKPLLL
jgi:hypothetical protein